MLYEYRTQHHGKSSARRTRPCRCRGVSRASQCPQASLSRIMTPFASHPPNRDSKSSSAAGGAPSRRWHRASFVRLAASQNLSLGLVPVIVGAGVLRGRQVADRAACAWVIVAFECAARIIGMHHDWRLAIDDRRVLVPFESDGANGSGADVER
ncbi:hypothetical protein FIBSPDRAFT_364640 [Athelia psychrophila]|uniref:Uncharacterized protein n=1 Tax=Athelia psychrophila TaxID=1759441 RepID=A0A166PH62_9AGAM|nr:hypothetical protein FIBSPDRAFT_364640 [Fibularhizoctonia sp. CBS 109695]